MAKIVMIGKFNRIWDEEGKARSFEKLGHKVVRIEEVNFSDQSISEIIKLKPDLVIFAKLKVLAKDAKELIEQCILNQIKTVSWHPDLYWGLSRQYQLEINPVFKANAVCSPDGGNGARFKSLGISHRVVRQGVYDEDCFLGKPGALYDIIFVGTDNPASPHRLELMGFLRKTYGQKFTWFGRGNEDEVRGSELNDLIASSKIVIGDSVPSRAYWSNRIYETIGRGGFTIHPMIEELGTEYEPYKHFVPYTYSDFAGLKEKIDYYLEHPQERDIIRLAGMEHTKKNLTLLNKCQQLLDIML